MPSARDAMVARRKQLAFGGTALQQSFPSGTGCWAFLPEKPKTIAQRAGRTVPGYLTGRWCNYRSGNAYLYSCTI